MKLPELLRTVADLVETTNEDDPEAIKAFYQTLVMTRDTLNEIIEAYPG